MGKVKNFLDVGGTTLGLGILGVDGNVYELPTNQLFLFFYIRTKKPIQLP